MLKHARGRHLVIGTSKVIYSSCNTMHTIIDLLEFELTPLMPSLLYVDAEKSRVRVLRVGAREIGIVKCITPQNGCNVIELGM